MNSKKNTTAYADCFSGVSGDMFLGALLDAGLPAAHLRGELAGLNMDDYRLVIRQQKQGAICATNLTIETEEKQPHRSWKTIRRLIEQSDLTAVVKKKVLEVFAGLAAAEAKIHGRRIDDIHFHEVGGLDAIIDIVGTVIGLTYFGVERLICSPLPMPHGWITCRHGRLPVPAPAVYEILKGTPVYGVEQKQELITPTGAALLKAMSRGFGPLPSMIISHIGYGAGDRRAAGQYPNLFRLVIGKGKTVKEAQDIEVIETNLDDWSPEGFPFLTERLFALGALDVCLLPVHMKKGRPGFLLLVIAAPAAALQIKQCILSETSAIGLRFRTERRMTLPRTSGTINSRWGPITVKKVETPNGAVLYPEYEACRQAAKANNVPLKKIYDAVACCSPAEFVETDG